jgi:phage terminase large subunit-like protein
VTAAAPSPYATVLDAARWYQANPLALWKPSPAFAPFMADETRRILIRAANRVGKTKHAAARLAKLMVEVPNRHYRVVGTNFKDTQLVAGGYLHGFLPKHMLTSSSRYSEQRGWNYEKLVLTNGTSCEFRTFEQIPDQHAGGDMDGVWCDEPPPPLIWNECLRRVMSRGGFLWLTFTPLGREVGWLRKIVEDKSNGWREYVAKMSAENCPWYAPEKVESWIREVRASMPDAYEQTINGAWEGITGGRTFTGYDSSSHLVIGASESVADVLPRDVKWGVGVDHGEGAGKQWAGLVAWTGQGTGSKLWILDECVSKGVTTPNQDAKAIRLMLQRNGLDVVNVNRWKGDINTAGKGEPGRSANEVLAQHLAKEAGYHRFPREFESADKGAGSILKGEMLLNAAFLQRRAWVRADRCPVLSRSLAHYVADAKKSEDLKHPLDGLRYIAVPVLDPGEEIPTLGSVSLGFG